MVKSFCLSLSPLLGWTKGEGERSSVTTRLSPNHRVSVCSTLCAMITFLHPVPLAQVPTLYISKTLTHPLCTCTHTLHNTHALHMHTRQYVHTYICTYTHDYKFVHPCVYIAPASYPLLPAVVSLVVVVLFLITCVALLALALAVTATKH